MGSTPLDVARSNLAKNGQISRNALCPCKSGKKYKRYGIGLGNIFIVYIVCYLLPKWYNITLSQKVDLQRDKEKGSARIIDREWDKDNKIKYNRFMSHFMMIFQE